ncbi:hypothetical protein F442_03611 [Phytophthora nicotianae P10297]|uniref:Transposase Tc1-like domain-containing protein n=2 Tax=Phytophthora nicotianae TaxID=4792 RepID=W2ZV45_PHYNI|nr:hypothetical protein F442_03611 [Phytophthora nicotianae P10297]
MRPPNLTPTQRQTIVCFLLGRSDNGEISGGDISAAVAKYERHRSTISRLWELHKKTRTEENRLGNLASGLIGNCGRKAIDTDELRLQILKIPLSRRMTIKSLAAALGVSTTVIRRLLKEGAFRRHSSNVKPALTEENRLARVQFALSHTTSEVVRWYSPTYEEEPVRQRQSKRFISKTMFIAAVARPRYDAHRKQAFDGKIGIWAFAEEYEAKRTSKNRPKGTIVLRNVESVDREAYKATLIGDIIPAIKAKWPRSGKKRTIYIQQDNAKPHVSVDDPDIMAAGRSGGWDIRMRCQPPNSPDLNVLDLGYFRSIQSLQYQTECRGVEALLDAVNGAFSAMKADTLNKIFMTLQTCMECIIRANGGNNYKTPHRGKDALKKAGQLPVSFACSAEVYDQGVKFVRAALEAKKAQEKKAALEARSKK